VTTATILGKFDLKTFLSTSDDGKRIVAFPKRKMIFVQGGSPDAVYYIRQGSVKLTVVSNQGRSAAIGIRHKGDFLGESSLTGQPLCQYSAFAVTDCSLMIFDKKFMIDALQREHAFSHMFVAYLLERNIQYQEDLVDHLFNSSEKRLARQLISLARFGKEGNAEVLVPKVSQKTLAEIVGTTRERVNFFMNRFRKSGFIDYRSGDALEVHHSLLSVLLYD